MKNWKTTVAGVTAGLIVLGQALANGASLGQPGVWLVPVILAVWGALQKDHDQAGK